MRRAAEAGAFRFASAVHPPVTVPAALNSYGLWVALMIGLTVTNYGFPIAAARGASGHVGARCLRGSAVMSARDSSPFEIRYISRQRRRHRRRFVLSALGGFILLPLRSRS